MKSGILRAVPWIGMRRRRASAERIWARACCAPGVIARHYGAKDQLDPTEQKLAGEARSR
jgi:hypothetical protein